MMLFVAILILFYARFGFCGLPYSQVVNDTRLLRSSTSLRRSAICDECPTPEFCFDGGHSPDFTIGPPWEVMKIVFVKCDIYGYAYDFCASGGTIDPYLDINHPMCTPDHPLNAVALVDYDPVNLRFKSVGQIVKINEYWGKTLMEEHGTYHSDYGSKCDRYLQVVEIDHQTLYNDFNGTTVYTSDGGSIERIPVDFGMIEISPSTVPQLTMYYDRVDFNFVMTTITKNEVVNSTILNRGILADTYSEDFAEILLPFALPVTEEFVGFEIILDPNLDKYRFMIQALRIHGHHLGDRNYMEVTLIPTSGEKIMEVYDGMLSFKVTTTRKGKFPTVSQKYTQPFRIGTNVGERTFKSIAQQLLFVDPKNAWNAYLAGVTLSNGATYTTVSYYPDSDKKWYEFKDENPPKMYFAMDDDPSHDILVTEEIDFIYIPPTSTMWDELPKDHFDCSVKLCSGYTMKLGDKWQSFKDGFGPKRVYIKGQNVIDVIGDPISLKRSIITPPYSSSSAAGMIFDVNELDKQDEIFSFNNNIIESEDQYWYIWLIGGLSLGGCGYIVCCVCVFLMVTLLLLGGCCSAGVVGKKGLKGIFCCGREDPYETLDGDNVILRDQNFS